MFEIFFAFGFPMKGKFLFEERCSLFMKSTMIDALNVFHTSMALTLDKLKCYVIILLKLTIKIMANGC